MTNRPNLLFIMCDQMKAAASHLYGNTFCETPSLERLARIDDCGRQRIDRDERAHVDDHRLARVALAVGVEFQVVDDLAQLVASQDAQADRVEGGLGVGSHGR